MQELRLPEVELEADLRLPAEPSALVVHQQPAPDFYGPQADVILTAGTDRNLPLGGVDSVRRSMAIIGKVAVLALAGIGLVWVVAYLAHACTLQRGAATAARYTAGVAVVVIAIVMISGVVRGLARSQVRRGGPAVTVELKLGAAALALGPDDVPDDPELRRWLTKRCADNSYHLIRIVCCVDGGNDLEVDELTLRVSLQPFAGTGPEPQVISLSRSTQVRATVTLGANLDLIAAPVRAGNAVIARGELQQTAIWQLPAEAGPAEDKQFLLVVERAAATPAQATIEVTAVVLRSGATGPLIATYAGSPLLLR